MIPTSKSLALSATPKMLAYKTRPGRKSISPPRSQALQVAASWLAPPPTRPRFSIDEAGTIAARPRFLFITLCTFAAIALLLVAVGVFSVISYTVAMQSHEIGIRIALGAQATQILSLVVNRGMRVILCGILIGLFASYFLTRFLSSQIWGVSTTDPYTFAAIASLAFFVGILAGLIPARGASRVDPMVALRHE
jgi:predicted lysophospholipase L1 biosynthesis ABC-type transport system permease subunit